jgi:antitoxin Phd
MPTTTRIPVTHTGRCDACPNVRRRYAAGLPVRTHVLDGGAWAVDLPLEAAFAVMSASYKTAATAYDVGMSEITVSEARARLADVVDAARVGHDPVYLTRRGQRVAAVIDAEDLDRLIAAAEDLADIEAAAAARAEMDEGEPAIPWDQVKADLGLT